MLKLRQFCHYTKLLFTCIFNQIFLPIHSLQNNNLVPLLQERKLSFSVCVTLQYFSHCGCLDSNKTGLTCHEAVKSDLHHQYKVNSIFMLWKLFQLYTQVFLTFLFNTLLVILLFTQIIKQLLKYWNILYRHTWREIT